MLALAGAGDVAELYSRCVRDPVLRERVYDRLVVEDFDAREAGFSSLSVIGAWCSAETATRG